MVTGRFVSPLCQQRFAAAGAIPIWGLSGAQHLSASPSPPIGHYFYLTTVNLFIYLITRHCESFIYITSPSFKLAGGAL
jgi:hypothetical protein